MEKASDVYNKLKLRFVGKTEMAAKPQTENKETEKNEKESQNTGKKPHLYYTSFYKSGWTLDSLVGSY